MNTLGASLASFRSTTETPAGRAARDDENPAAFGTLLGALSEEPAAAGPTDARDALADAEIPADASPQGDAASALTILAAIDSSSAMTSAMMGLTAGTGGKPGADPIEALIARALPAAVAARVPASGALGPLPGDEAPLLSPARDTAADPATAAPLGRLRVTVIAQETHFAPVKPHPVSLMAASSTVPSLIGPGAATDRMVDPGRVQAPAAVAAEASQTHSRPADDAAPMRAAASGVAAIVPRPGPVEATASVVPVDTKRTADAPPGPGMRGQAASNGLPVEAPAKPAALAMAADAAPGGDGREGGAVPPVAVDTPAASPAPAPSQSDFAGPRAAIGASGQPNRGAAVIEAAGAGLPAASAGSVAAAGSVAPSAGTVPSSPWTPTLSSPEGTPATASLVEASSKPGAATPSLPPVPVVVEPSASVPDAVGPLPAGEDAPVMASAAAGPLADIGDAAFPSAQARDPALRGSATAPGTGEEPAAPGPSGPPSARSTGDAILPRDAAMPGVASPPREAEGYSGAGPTSNARPALAMAPGMPAPSMAEQPVQATVANVARPGLSPTAASPRDAVTLLAPIAEASVSAAQADHVDRVDAAARTLEAPPPSEVQASPSHASPSPATQSAVAAANAVAKPARNGGGLDSTRAVSDVATVSGDILMPEASMRTEAAPASLTPQDREPVAGPLREALLEVGQANPSAVTLSSSVAGEPSRQIAEAVVAQMGRPAAALVAAQPGMEGPLRILTIQLRPDDLGTVLVRMRLRGDQLEMSLHASREETAALLRSDAGALDGLLRGAGYQPDLVTISSGRGDAPNSGEPARAGFDGPDGQASDPGGAMAGQSGRREPDQRDAERRNTLRETTSDETTPAGPGRIGRYL